MSQETVRFSPAAWRAVGATIASQGSQGQASPVQEEAPTASPTPATETADSFLNSFLQEAERDAVGEMFEAGRSAAQQATTVSEAVAAGAALEQALRPCALALQRVAALVRGGPPGLVAALVPALRWLRDTETACTAPSAWAVEEEAEGSAPTPPPQLPEWQELVRQLETKGSKSLAAWAQAIGSDVRTVLNDGGAAVVGPLISRLRTERAQAADSAAADRAAELAAAAERLGRNADHQIVVEVDPVPFTSSILLNPLFLEAVREARQDFSASEADVAGSDALSAADIAARARSQQKALAAGPS